MACGIFISCGTVCIVGELKKKDRFAPVNSRLAVTPLADNVHRRIKT